MVVELELFHILLEVIFKVVNGSCFSVLNTSYSLLYFDIFPGDNNEVDDRMLYAPGQKWLERQHIMGRAVG